MNILSLRENESIAREADSLCKLIDSHERPLREVRLGRKFCLASASFQLFQQDRNTIYRIQNRSRWFLKMPYYSKNESAVKRETFGAEAVRDTLRAHPSYYHAGAIRASIPKNYVLYAEIPGRPLNLAFYRACFTPIPGGRRRIQETFRSFGDVLAHLHKNPVKDDILPTNRNVAIQLREVIDTIAEPDAVSLDITQWFEKCLLPSHEPTLVHGNLGPIANNVITRGGKVCFIDLENCGHGPLYQDLSLACWPIMLTHASPIFPRKRATLALSSLLDGYKRIFPYQRETLLQYITICICLYYIQTYCSTKGRTSIAGIPSSQSRFRKLVMAMLKGDINAVFPGIEL